MLKQKTTKIQKYQWGKPLTPANLKSPLSATNNFSGVNKANPTMSGRINTPTSSNPTQGMITNQMVSGFLQGGTTAMSGFANAEKMELEGTAKTSAQVDGVVSGVTQGLMASGNPWLMAGGAALAAIDGIGGSLMNKGKAGQAAKKFDINESIQGSTGYGGISGQANKMKEQGDAYRNAGLFGKLFSNKQKMMGGFNTSNMSQAAGAGILDKNRLAMDSAAASQDMVAAKNQNQIYNTSMWNNGSVQMGQSGGTLNVSGSTPNKTVEAYKKLGKASKTINVKRIAKNVAKHQQGGKFEQWYKAVAKHKGLDSNPYAKEHFYDYKTFFEKEPELAKRLLTDDKDAHFTDIGKLPGHPTFSNESAYFNESNKKQAGYWNGDIYMPFDEKKGATNTITGKTIPPVVKYQDVTSHKGGGAINVIADGALHARKHTLKETENYANADITLKGIPVVSFDEKGGVIQHAEIEVNELVLHYDLSKELEKLHEDGSEEAMIKAGKLLSKEIVKNTKDSKSKILKDAKVTDI